MKKLVSILAFAAAMRMTESKSNPAVAEIYERACKNGSTKERTRLGRFITTAKE
ncbi:hypothetical protein [Campylobacter showae]|uniref:hypothetical protein n=1 Tax=Campylobacter showae TaxID=204 RepID=UPI0013D68BA6|nr:hypothetical protein [Campylobacter showae]